MPHFPRFEDAVPARISLVVARKGWPLTAALLAAFGCEGAISDEASARPWRGSAGTSGLAAASGAGPAGLAGPGAVSNNDAVMRAANPSLFDAARAYFPQDNPLGSPQRLFRLTRSQLDATTKALLPGQYSAALADSMPRDPLQTNYEYADNLSFNAANFTPYTRWVEQLAANVRANPSSVIACSANNDVMCLDAEAKRFTARAFRGVASDDVLQRFSTFYVASVGDQGFAAATGDLVDVTLTSPEYVFRDEVRTTTDVMSAAQQLQNISYTLTDAPPESVGLSFAEAAALVATPDAVQKTIDKALASSAARDKLLRFFVSWLEVREPDEFTIAADVFPEFTPELAAAVVEETHAFLQHQLANAAPKLKDLTQSTQTFVTKGLSEIYGRAKTVTTGVVDLDPTQRLGIFTLPAVIASHSGPTTTRLVKRGVFFTRKVMCLPLGLPPPGVNTTLPTIDGATERTRVETATAAPRCQGCHAFINPFGFMQENYDAIGRWRTTDVGLPIDASIHVDFLDEGPLKTKTPIDALKQLTSSLRFQQCFARQLFRFYLGRDELAGDDPVLREMFFGFANQNDQNILGMLRTLARSKTFSQRRLNGSDKP